MNAREALESAARHSAEDRLHRYETTCKLRGFCRTEALTNDAGRWTRCLDCLTVYDDFGVAVNGLTALPPRAPH